MIAESLSQVAPIYNLGFVIIVIFLFLKLLSTPIRDKRVYLLPWKIIFFAVTIYIVEEGLTILRQLEIINVPVHINGFFELIIICTFIYMLLMQKEHLKKTKS